MIAKTSTTARGPYERNSKLLLSEAMKPWKIRHDRYAICVEAGVPPNISARRMFNVRVLLSAGIRRI